MGRPKVCVWEACGTIFAFCMVLMARALESCLLSTNQYPALSPVKILKPERHAAGYTTAAGSRVFS